MTHHFRMSVTSKKAWKSPYKLLQSLSCPSTATETVISSRWCSCKMVDIWSTWTPARLCGAKAPAAQVGWVTRGKINFGWGEPLNFGLVCYCRKTWPFLTNVSLFWLIGFLRSPPESQPPNYTISHHCKLSFSYVTHIAIISYVIICVMNSTSISWDFPCSPVAKTVHSQCRGLRFNPWSGN